MTAPVFITDAREAKLPVWAQEKLQQLRHTVSELHKTVEAVQGGTRAATSTWPGGTTRRTPPCRRGPTSPSPPSGERSL